MKSTWALASIGALAGALLLSLPARPQEPAVAAGSDISGFWDLAVDSRKVPTAQLLPRITKQVLAAQARKDAHAVRWCNFLGTPFIMDSGRPLDIQVGQRSVILYSEAPVEPRYVYLDRKEHIAGDEYDQTTGGDSIGHWEGDTLVVDTVGFAADHGITLIPGGGFRTDTSHLVERFRLVEEGAMLSVVFTWTDPKVFSVPHTYEFRYYRLPQNFEPVAADVCDPWDEERARFLDAPVVAGPTAKGHS